MTDIVDELRARALQGPFNLDAASEIRKLRAELAEKNAAIIQINNICLRVEQECDTLRAELSEQFRLLDMSAEREAKHLAQTALMKQKYDDLRAKIDAMEQQEPVAWLHESRRDSDVVTSAVKHVWQRARPMSLAAYSIPLYLAPGAKGEEKHS